MPIVHNAWNKELELERILGRGGEATIWTVKDQPNWAAKLYHQPTPRHEAKLQAIIADPPLRDDILKAAAWPLELLYQDKTFVGYLQPQVHRSVSLFQLYNPVQRNKHYPSVTWCHLHRVAVSLVKAISAIHAKGYVIGDLNESNILINTYLQVTFIDTDSFQVEDYDRQIMYFCEVGKPEYTPPELQGQTLREVPREMVHDYFGLGVLLFQLLVEGYHPFAGVVPKGQSVGRVDLYCISQGIFPYATQTRVTPPPHAPAFTLLHPSLQAIFIQCFVDGHRHPNRRPTPEQWSQALIEAEANLVACPYHPQHVYASHLSTCPWCAIQETTLGMTWQPAFVFSPLPITSQSASATNPRPLSAQPSSPFIQRDTEFWLRWYMMNVVAYGVTVFLCLTGQLTLGMIVGSILGLLRWDAFYKSFPEIEASILLLASLAILPLLGSLAWAINQVNTSAAVLVTLGCLGCVDWGLRQIVPSKKP